MFNYWTENSKYLVELRNQCWRKITAWRVNNKITQVHYKNKE